MEAARTQTIAVQARVDAAKTKPVVPNIKVAEPKTRVPEPKTRIAAPRANEHVMESTVFPSLTEQYELLKLELEDGIITAVEYESRKRKLECNF